VTTPARRLTDIAIQNLKPGPVRYEVPDPGAQGLRVVVQPSGRKSFAIRYRFQGQTRKLTLPAGISLAMARKLAADALHTLAQGHDPGETRKAQRAKAILARADTVENICESFLRRKAKDLRSAGQLQHAYKRLVYPVLGDRPVNEVTRSQINKWLDNIEDKTGLRSAELALQCLRRAFDWHAIQTDSFLSPIVRGMARYKISEHQRTRFLDDNEIREVWRASEGGNTFDALVRFLLLTGARRSEAAGIAWAEITGNVWRLPAARNKGKVDLLRPLSKAALALLHAQPRILGSDLIFTVTGKHPIQFSRGKKDFDRRCAVKDWQLHDTRRTVRTLLARCNIPVDVAERCLGHTLAPLRRTYDRHDYLLQMETAFEALASTIGRIVHPPRDAVTPLRRRM
jgi:integrase